MSERKFTRGLGKPGMAAQVRETVSQVVRESTVQNKPQLIEPIDFESFILKNKTVLQNDTHRELLLYPTDDVSQVVLPRRYRTLIPVIPNKMDTTDCNLFTKMCINSYSSNWNLVHYKYNVYSATFVELPKPSKVEEYREDIYEIDTDVDKSDNDDANSKNTRITKQGYLMKGPEIGGSDRMFPNIGSKSFKKRYCFLRHEVDGTYILELYKDEKKGDAKVTIVMDFCTDVISNVKKGRFCFELRMTSGHKSYSLAADNETEYKDWINKLSSVLQQNKIQEDKRAASLERSATTTPSASSSTPPSVVYGTLKSLEQSMNPQLIKYARETEISIAHARRNARRKLFNIYYPIQQQLKSSSSSVVAGGGGGGSGSGESTITNNNIEPYKEQFGQRIYINCECLKFKLQVPYMDVEEEPPSPSEVIEGGSGDQPGELCQLEPYFTTLCLFDARNNKKLTENFYFDVNDKNSRRLIQNGGGGHHQESSSLEMDAKTVEDNKYIPNEWIMYPKQCIFSVTNPHPDIFLVVRIDKILQGNIYQTTEPYIKYNATKDLKQAIKLYKTTKMYCQRTQKYRQPFAWAARPLFRMYSNELDTTNEFPAIYRQDASRLTDDELLKLLSEYRKPVSKLTIIPGVLKIHVENLLELPPENTLTTNLIPLKLYPLPPKKAPTLEVIEFNKITNPYTIFINNLYVYPQHLMFDQQKVFARARNIVVCIELRDSDNIMNYKSLYCIYKQFNKHLFVNKVYCSVLHHNTTPTWYDEIKIKLPINITTKHHLLFTFYHISCEINKKITTNQYENCIGYAWIPLLQKNGKLNVDLQVIPVATHLPSGYLSIQPLGLGKGNAGPDIHWIDNQKSIFTVNFNLISSVNTIDQHLYNLFINTERLFTSNTSTSSSSTTSSTVDLIHMKSTLLNINENELCKILKALHAIQLTTLIKFLPTILNHLFTILIITSTSDEICLNIIRVMINLIHMLYEANKQDVLRSYIKYVFIIPTITITSSTTTTITNNKQSQIHFELIKHLSTILHPNNTDFLVVNKFMKHSTFFFDIIIKSMAQYLLTTGRIKMHRNERFSKEYLQKIETLLQVLVPYITTKYKEMPFETYELNKSIAHFLKKCLSFMDRGNIFKLINIYIDKFNNNETTGSGGVGGTHINVPRILNEYKFKFIKIICSHEHYIILNLPIEHIKLTTSPTISPITTTTNKLLKDNNNIILNRYYLNDEFCKHHFIVGLLLKEIRRILMNEMNYNVRKLAIITLRDLLAKHELDDRYQMKGQLNRIILLYIPFINIIIEHLYRINIEEEYKNNNNNTNIINNEQQQQSTSTSINNTNVLNKITTTNNATTSSSSSSNSITSSSLSYLNKYLTTNNININNNNNKSQHRFTLHLDHQSSTSSSSSSPIHYQHQHQHQHQLRDSTYFAAIAGQGLLNGGGVGNLSTMSLDSDVSTMSGGDNASTISQETTIIRNNNTNNDNTTTTSIQQLEQQQNDNSIILNNDDNELLNHYHQHNRSISNVIQQQQQQQQHKHKHQQQQQRNDKLQQTEIKDILICILFILKYISDDHLIQWWQQSSDLDSYHFFILLEKCLYCFKYIGKEEILAKKTNIELSSMNSNSNGGCSGGISNNSGGGAGTNNDHKVHKVKAHTLPARMNPPTEYTTTSTTTNDNTTTTTTTTYNTTQRESLIKIENETTKLFEAQLDGNVSTECGLIILDCIGLYSMHFNKKLLENDGDNLIMHKIFNIYLIFLQIGSSELLLQHVFASLRAHINLYAIILFKGNATLCGLLCYHILLLCNSRIAVIRHEACALLYLLMRSNFEYNENKSITRIHLQVIISVSQMLGNKTTQTDLNNSRFHESLSLINSYATSDKAMKNTIFINEVKDLTKRIRTVLMATIHMHEYVNDPEMLIDLQHSLANSYASTPELRRTWLETMTTNHINDQNYIEAAMCQLHIAGLMTEYIQLKHKNINFNIGMNQFNNISMNIIQDECHLKLDDDNNMTNNDDTQYTEHLLIKQLEQCIKYIELSEHYELLDELYHLITPYYLKKYDYSKLSEYYLNLSKAYNQIITVYKTGKRLFGRYYRVIFYGVNYFDEQSGIEYIYKEQKLTTLYEISERLQKQFSIKYGSENIKMIMDSIQINVNDLDQKYGYIQVTHVVPYYYNSDVVVKNEFQLNHNIACFMYETPFTKELGKVRGAPEEQWKRRTILTTQYAFPYVKKRIIVIDRQIEELSPIEVAIDEMQQRVSELEDVVFTEPTDIKKLQLRLQGSVCVQVNAGPLAYASVFLDPTLSNLYPDDKVDELKDIFREFLKICYTALQINSKLITSDQLEYQEALRQNYKKLCMSLSTLFGEALWPHDETGSFKRNSLALFSAISGASHNSSTA